MKPVLVLVVTCILMNIMDLEGVDGRTGLGSRLTIRGRYNWSNRQYRNNHSSTGVGDDDSTGMIVGIVIGSVFLVVIINVVLLIFCRTPRVHITQRPMN